MRYTASLSFYFDSSFLADVVCTALKPEIHEDLSGSDVELSVEDEVLYLDISSDELSMLRATCNSYLRWLGIASSVATVE